MTKAKICKCVAYVALLTGTIFFIFIFGDADMGITLGKEILARLSFLGASAIFWSLSYCFTKIAEILEDSAARAAQKPREVRKPR